jgi:hypothetical protein
LSVPATEHAPLCPGRNGRAAADLTRGMRFSAIIKIDCLRKGPNLMAGRAPFDHFCLPRHGRIDEDTDGI